MSARVAVVTVVRGRHQQLHRQQRSLSQGRRLPDDWVVVAMDDPALEHWRVLGGVPPHVVPLPTYDGELPLAAARNLGARTALARGADVLVFLDVDCLAGPDLVTAYAEAALDERRTVWSGPVTYLPAGLSERDLLRPWEHDDPHPARPVPGPGEVVRDGDPALFWSLSFALSAEAWSATGGFHEQYVGYGGEDTDFALVAVGSGLSLSWLGSARAYHQHHPVHDPPVEHVDAIVRNAALFYQRWSRWPMEGWLRSFADLGLVSYDDEAGWVRRPQGPEEGPRSLTPTGARVLDAGADASPDPRAPRPRG